MRTPFWGLYLMFRQRNVNCIVILVNDVYIRRLNVLLIWGVHDMRQVRAAKTVFVSCREENKLTKSGHCGRSLIRH